MPTAIGRTLAYGRTTLPDGNNCILFVSATKPASDRDWSEYVTWLQKALKPGEKLKSLVYDRAGGPNAAQRKQLNDITASCSLQVAVITPSPIGRGVVTAMSWFKKDGYKPFSPNELDDALVYLGLSGATAAEVRKTVLEMLRDLDRNA